MIPLEPQPSMPPQFRATPQLLLGAMVIVVGVLMTLDNLEILDAERYVRFWPAGLVAIGLLKLVEAREGHGGGLVGVLFLMVGSWLLLEQTTAVRLSFWDMWPLLLVVFGGFLVWQALAGGRSRPGPAQDPIATPAPAPAQSDANSVLTGMAVLGSLVRGNNSAAFRGGELTAILGGCEIDLRHASIDGEAVIEVFSLWGGIEIKVPSDWTVVSQITPILAGVEDKTRPPQTASRHRLVLRGFIIMAGVEIQN
jgi:hypothetical protein